MFEPYLFWVGDRGEIHARIPVEQLLAIVQELLELVFAQLQVEVLETFNKPARYFIRHLRDDFPFAVEVID